MHEIERHRLILNLVEEQPVATLAQLVTLTGTSEVTIRRDIRTLDKQGRLRRVRGGAEALNPPQQAQIMGRPFSVNETERKKEKRAIAKAAAALCRDGDAIIINGGTTTCQMTRFLLDRRLQVLTNSFPIAEVLLKHSRNTITLPGGAIYREPQIVLSPFDNDITGNFCASKMFMGAHALGPLGVMEADPLLIQAEQKLINQAEELIVLVDSDKFDRRSSLILCGLDRVNTVITDNGISPRHEKMMRQANTRLVVVDPADGNEDGPVRAA